jgi:uncharacterized integral membrane protein
MKRFFKVLFLLIFGGLIAAFAVANRQPVRFVLDPFINRDLAASVEAPFYGFLFGALFVGIFIGAAIVWFGQGRWRRAARARSREAAVWKREAESLKAGLQDTAGSAPAVAVQRPLRSL